MIGFYKPVDVEGKINWEVTMLEEGVGYSAETQIMAELLSNQEMIKAMLMKDMNISKNVDCNYKKRCSSIGEKCERCRHNKNIKIDYFDEIITNDDIEKLKDDEKYVDNLSKEEFIDL